MWKIHARMAVIQAALIVLSTLAAAAPAAAAHPSAVVPCMSIPVAPDIPVCFASSISWNGFVQYWTGFVRRSDRVVLAVSVVAATALFIITRGRWMK